MSNYPTACAQFLQHAQQTPHKVMVSCSGNHYTYEQAERLSANLASHLQTLGLGQGHTAAILIKRCELMPILALAVMRTGAAYLPLDSQYPPERLEYMIKDANCRIVIAHPELANLLPAQGPHIISTSELAELPAKSFGDLSNPNQLCTLLYTSGTTGQPKGVKLLHRNVSAFIAHYAHIAHFDENCLHSSYASFGFDAHLAELIAPLAVGASILVVPDELRLNLVAVNQLWNERQVTHAFLTTQLGRHFAIHGQCPSLQCLMTGGEKLAAIDKLPSFTLLNAYGPSEAACFVTSFAVDKTYDNIPIGRPNPETVVYIVQDGRSLAPGQIGEICICSNQVGPGYLNRPDLTAKVFQKNPFYQPGQPDYMKVMYCSGDLGMLNEAGCLLFVGRRDNQVKIRGYRIELDEVEKVIRDFPGVNDVTVQAFDSPAGGKFMAAYVVSAQPLSEETIKAFIGRSKPDYMVPAVIMAIDKIPLNTNHKVDRRALPQPTFKTDSLKKPSTELGQTIYNLAVEALGHSEFGIDTPLTQVGLTSLAAARLIMTLSQVSHCPLSVALLTEHSTVSHLEAWMSQAETPPAEAAAELASASAYPLSAEQLGAYLDIIENPQSLSYNLGLISDLGKERLNLEKLRSALHQVASAHPLLKAYFGLEEGANGQAPVPCQYPLPERSLNIPLYQMSEAEFANLKPSLVKPFRFAKLHEEFSEELSLCRFAIYRTEKSDYLFSDIFHAICDGHSEALIYRDLDRAYNDLPLHEESFSAFHWQAHQQRLANSSQHSRAMAYLESLFADSDCSMRLPSFTAHKRDNSRGTSLTFSQSCPQLRIAEVDSFCRRQHISPNVFFMAAFGLTLACAQGRRDAVFCTIYHGRSTPAAQDLVGMLVKTLPVLCNPGQAESVSTYLQDCQNEWLHLMSLDSVSFPEISRVFNIRPDIMLIYQGELFDEFNLGPVTIAPQQQRFDAIAPLSYEIYPDNGHYRLVAACHDSICPEAAARSFLEAYLCVLQSMLETDSFSSINLLTPEARATLDHFNHTEAQRPFEPVTKTFESQVQLYPERLALVTDQESLTYAQLNSLTNRLAAALRQHNLPPEALIALMTERSTWAYIGRMGILKAGAAFMPVGLDYPEERRNFILRDSQTPLLLIERAALMRHPQLIGQSPCRVMIIEDLLATVPGDPGNPEPALTPASLCYCLYTSGTTGTPKGALLEHGNLSNYVVPHPQHLHCLSFTEGGQTSLALAALTFDVSVMENFVPLCNGMTVCLASQEAIHNPLVLGDFMQKNQVTIMTCVPSFILNMLSISQLEPVIAQLRSLNVGGENFPGGLYAQLHRLNPQLHIYNCYGPTEATISCTCSEVTGAEIVLGRAMTNAKIEVLSRWGQPLPVNMIGELTILGQGVGRGYLNNPDLTSRKFFPMQGLRAYRSGDLTYRKADGDLVFFGRIDSQVKLRGQRIDLGEIDAQAAQVPGVSACATVLKTLGSNKQQHLCLYYTSEHPLDSETIRLQLKKVLTSYMVPTVYMQLEKMPLTANGKIALKQLPEPVVTHSTSSQEPTTAAEKDFCAIFSQILGVTPIGSDSDFFDLGGTSLQVTQVALAAEQRGYSLTYSDVFDYSTPQAISKFLSGQAKASLQPQKEIAQADYSVINHLLEKNNVAEWDKSQLRPLGNVLLTGATGFLGIHILRELLDNSQATCWCLMRKGRQKSLESRLKGMLVYYFDRDFDEYFGKRLFLIEGDVTDMSGYEQCRKLPINTVINCAANVKHFASGAEISKVNVEGVRNGLAYSRSVNAQFVQISTTSVAGLSVDGHPDPHLPFNEQQLYIGQSLDNKYILSKFAAEKLVLEACAAGQTAKIIRVGNLMARSQDGEFQVNLHTNSFINILKALHLIGKVSYEQLAGHAELTSIDYAAKAILLLSQTPPQCCLFHAFNNHAIYLADLIKAMNKHNLKVALCNETDFSAAFQATAADESKVNQLSALVAYRDLAHGHRAEELQAENAYTMQVLYRLGFQWPLITDHYLDLFITSLCSLGFFDSF